MVEGGKQWLTTGFRSLKAQKDTNLLTPDIDLGLCEVPIGSHVLNVMKVHSVP